jgi:hypothetical protein
MDKRIQHGHSYKGFVYQPWVEYDSDNMKIFHDVVTPEGKTIDFDWSPYSTPTAEQFSLWIDLGCPGRVGIGPLRDEDLKKIANR